MDEQTTALPQTRNGELRFAENAYTSPPFRAGFFARMFPALYFYAGMAAVVYKGSKEAGAGNYSDADWVESSRNIARTLERAGGRLELEGLDVIHALKEPCLFVGNHMSTLETFLLPCLIQPWKPVTFVIKDSLNSYPFFGPIMRSRNPIVVGRENPRGDFTIVMEGGEERLQRGISIVIFPQSTRMEAFDPSQFNSIGIKLAKRVKVPVIPVALRTDFWGNGTLIKEFGPIRPQSTVHMRFGQPLEVSGNGKAEHAAVLDFIRNNLNDWGIPPMEPKEAVKEAPKESPDE